MHLESGCPDVIFSSHRSASGPRALPPDDNRARQQRDRDPKPCPAAQARRRHNRISLPSHGRRSVSLARQTRAETRRRLRRGASGGSGANAIAISRPAKHDERLASNAQDMFTGHGVRSARKSGLLAMRAAGAACRRAAAHKSRRLRRTLWRPAAAVGRQYCRAWSG